MGGIFLRRPWRSKVEVINDISGDVTTLFRVLQRHYVAFMDMLKWQLTSRAEFERLNASNPETLTDLERAARFLYLQRTAFGGKVVGRTFGTSTTSPARFDITKLGSMLEEVHERLAGRVRRAGLPEPSTTPAHHPRALGAAAVRRHRISNNPFRAFWMRTKRGAILLIPLVVLRK